MSQQEPQQQLPPPGPQNPPGINIQTIPQNQGYRADQTQQTNPPPQQAPQAQSPDVTRQLSDVGNAVNSLPERIVNAFTEAFQPQPPQQAPQPAQQAQTTAQAQQQAPPSQRQDAQQQATQGGQQGQQQGRRRLADWWFGR